MKLTYYFLTTVWLCLLACSDSPTGPEMPALPDPRQFTWSVDTLHFPGSLQTLMYRIWGSSPSNVYAVGHSDAADARMYHFDGKSWRNISFFNIGPHSLVNVFGFSANDVWVAGSRQIQDPERPWIYSEDSSMVMHFDGSAWRIPQIPRHRRVAAIWGLAPDDIWAGGDNGTVLHYDGTAWQRDAIPFDIPADLDPTWTITAITGTNEHGLYMLLAGWDNIYLEKSYLLRRESQNWVAVDSVRQSLFTRIWMSPQGTLYGAGSHVTRREGTMWTKMDDSILAPSLLTNTVFGTSDDNFFVAGHKGNLQSALLHYNGASWFEFTETQLPDVSYVDGWTNGQEVFVIGWTYIAGADMTIVAHGKRDMGTE